MKGFFLSIKKNASVGSEHWHSSSKGDNKLKTEP